MAEERKLATILFADLAGSTALADEEDPERTRARLERFYDAMAEEIRAAGGTIEKFAGDAVMAAFGAPEARKRTSSSRAASTFAASSTIPISCTTSISRRFRRRPQLAGSRSPAGSPSSSSTSSPT
jgi:class 3 adenylate cyclase